MHRRDKLELLRTTQTTTASLPPLLKEGVNNHTHPKETHGIYHIDTRTLKFYNYRETAIKSKSPNYRSDV